MHPEPSARGDRRYVGIGKYQVLKHLATGGMGAVYRAFDTERQREVALKVLPPDLAHRPGVLERFRREADIGSRLRHEHLVSIYEFGEAAGTFYLALEFVDGVDLHEYVRREGPLRPEDSLPLLTQAVLALDYAHRQGVVHRDIKPSNLLVTTRDGRPHVKLTDLGLALEVGDDQFRLTRDGSTVGTVDYMAPEQARDSRAADIRSDLYALGCTWFHMLTGRPPFTEGSLAERVYQHLEVEPPDVRLFNPQVPPGLVLVLRRMLAKRPEDRYQTPADLLADLQAGGPAVRPPVTPPPLPGSAIPAAQAAREARPAPTTPTSWPGKSGILPRLTREDAPLLPPPRAEHRRVAAGQFERARQVLDSGHHDYAISLLLSCCKLDPGNLTYRQALRRTAKAKHGRRPGGRWYAWLVTLGPRGRLRSAKRRNDHLKVIEHGEAVLAHNPWDVAVQVDMARAAEALGLVRLAVWLLEEARQKDPLDDRVNRHLARLYEEQDHFPEAIALWELVRKRRPDDGEAYQKTKDLAVRETILRGQYENEIGRRSAE